MFRPKTRRRTARRRTLGQSLVEFTLVFPVFMIVLAGTLDFGFLLYNRMSVINAAREGARAASVSSDYTAFQTNAQAAVQTTAPATSTFTVSCVRAGSSCNFNSAAGYKSGAGGDSVSVTVNYQYHSFFGSFFGNVITLTSTVQMVIE